MIERVQDTSARREKLEEYGKNGSTSINTVAESWGCGVGIILEHLDAIRSSNGYALLISADGCFRFFKDLKK